MTFEQQLLKIAKLAYGDHIWKITVDDNNTDYCRVYHSLAFPSQYQTLKTYTVTDDAIIMSKNFHYKLDTPRYTAGAFMTTVHSPNSSQQFFHHDKLHLYVTSLLYIIESIERQQQFTAQDKTIAKLQQQVQDLEDKLAKQKVAIEYTTGVSLLA